MHYILLQFFNCFSIGVSQLAVVVNKLDTVDWSNARYNEIVSQMTVFLRQAGFKEHLTFVPCSGLSGENIVTEPKGSLSNWYVYRSKYLFSCED